MLQTAGYTASVAATCQQASQELKQSVQWLSSSVAAQQSLLAALAAQVQAQLTTNLQQLQQFAELQSLALQHLAQSLSAFQQGHQQSLTAAQDEIRALNQQHSTKSQAMMQTLLGDIGNLVQAYVQNRQGTELAYRTSTDGWMMLLSES